MNHRILFSCKLMWSWSIYHHWPLPD